MSEHCGMIVTIKDVFGDTKGNAVYSMKEIDWVWTDEMIEGCVEYVNDISNIDKLKRISTPATENWFGIAEEWDKEDKGMDKLMDLIEHHCLKHELNLPDGYIFKDENGNVINAQKIVLEKKKKEYPKTYEECCDVLDIPSYYKLRYYTYEHGYNEYTTLNKLCSLQDKLNILGKLLICRDAYWKLYGEEIGLGKPWEPNVNKECFSIARSCGEVLLFRGYGNNEVFEFPTPEMRDAFKENFDKDLEFCKELL
jgi:hypothetical protein